MALLTNFVYGAYISLRFRQQSVNLLNREKMQNPKYLFLGSKWREMLFFFEEFFLWEFNREKEHISVWEKKSIYYKNEKGGHA